MKRLVAAAVLVAATALTVSAEALPRHVALVSRTPASVSGGGFAAHARVVVSLRAGRRTLTETRETTANGRFTARWSAAIPACSIVFVTARSGSVVTVARFVPASTSACGGPPGPLGPPAAGS